jgi:hypothetical protein
MLYMYLNAYICLVEYILLRLRNYYISVKIIIKNALNKLV